MDAIREKHKAKQEKAKQKYEEHKEKVESGERQLVTERTPEGLYFLKFDGGGQLPEVLKGRFTSIAKIRELIMAKYGRDMLKV